MGVYGFIYKIENMLNGRTYVGQHIGTELGDYWGSGVLIHRAYKKYGKDSFKRTILDYAASKEELNFMEAYYIQSLQTKAPNGYNIATGGRGGYTGELSEESRKKISQFHKGKPKTAEHRRHLSEAKKGISHAQTEETKRKISKSHMGIEPWNKGKGLSVSQFTKEGEFVRSWNSLTEASQNGFNISKISECLHGTRKTHGNFVWRLNNG